jgi:menaquinone-specific isochorismate synthase
VTTTFLAAGLVAHTREIDPPPDLLDALALDGFAWLFEGRGFVTSGVAARVPAAQASAVLAAVDVDDPIRRPGTGALAVGALPFTGAAAGELVIPAVVIGLDADGTHRGAWRTEIGPPPSDPIPRDRGGARESDQQMSTTFTIEGRVSRSEWRSQVRSVLDAIATGRLAKVVLARDVVVRSDAPFDPRAAIDRLRVTQGGCAVFASDGLVGATPELLVRRRGAVVESRPMAGTIARGATGPADDDAEAALAGSAKNGLEHRLVVEAVVDGLRDCGVDVTAVTGPEVVRLATVIHLATRIAGRVDDASATTSALELACALHPTPAVAGAPRDAALATLRELETFDRGRYAGPVGWVDARGDGEWGVALRCADLDGTMARLIAGAGIVSGSDPDAEWAETQAKLEPMLRVLVQP